MGNVDDRPKKGCYDFIVARLFKTKFLRLLSAIKHGNLTAVKMFHKQNVSFTQHNDIGDTPLHVATRYNKFEIVKYICENIPQININDKKFLGDTPLILAVMSGKIGRAHV